MPLKVVDPGHTYGMRIIDGQGWMPLVFVKRDDPPEKYPGNEGHYPGVIIQEVLRALIDRVKYLDNQVSAPENDDILIHLRESFWSLERRAHRRHGSAIPVLSKHIEEYEPCSKCGHIFCTWCWEQCDNCGHPKLKDTQCPCWEPFE